MSPELVTRRRRWAGGRSSDHTVSFVTLPPGTSTLTTVESLSSHQPRRPTARCCRVSVPAAHVVPPPPSNVIQYWPRSAAAICASAVDRTTPAVVLSAMTGVAGFVLESFAQSVVTATRRLRPPGGMFSGISRELAFPATVRAFSISPQLRQVDRGLARCPVFVRDQTYRQLCLVPRVEHRHQGLFGPARQFGH